MTSVLFERSTGHSINATKNSSAVDFQFELDQVTIAILHRGVFNCTSLAVVVECLTCKLDGINSERALYFWKINKASL